MGSLPDAHLRDLNLRITTDPLDPCPTTSSVHVQARYTTMTDAVEARRFHLEHLSRSGARIMGFGPADETGDAPVSWKSRWNVSAWLHDSGSNVQVAIDDFDDHRSIKISVGYDGFDHRCFFDTYAGWHSGVAPVAPHTRTTALEISTFAHADDGDALVLYTSDYAYPTTPRMIQRAVVDCQLLDRGLRYRERQPGFMFITDGEFDAETHVLGDHRSSQVSFVGEFPLALGSSGL